jgi:sulfur-oxidizing protein SoxX
MKLARTLALTLLAVAAGGAAPAAEQGKQQQGDDRQRVMDAMRASFKEKGQARLDRLEQDEVQAACSRTPRQGPLPAKAAKRLVAAQQATLVYPADGNLLGDWKQGEKIAQSGVGKQFSDDPEKPSGGNCYACHRLSKEEVSFGTLGPSLYQYGKLRGQGSEVQRYTYAKIYNPQAYTACSTMPRFGHHAILTEEQIRHLVALLLDPASPVNQ